MGCYEQLACSGANREEPGVMMPTSAPRPCSYPGCSNLVRSGRCELHPMQVVDQHNPEHQQLYNTRRWKMIRRLQLSQHPWCEGCLRANIYTPATDVDHIEPHRGDPARFYTGKLQSLCVPCHSRKAAPELVLSSKGSGAENVSLGY